jgi:hypothetical protein
MRLDAVLEMHTALAGFQLHMCLLDQPVVSPAPVMCS